MKATQEIDDEMVRLRIAGVSAKEIARQFDVSLSTVHRLLRLRGVKRKPIGRVESLRRDYLKKKARVNRGLCSKCNEPLATKWFCAAHTAKAKAYTLARRHERIAQDRCVACGKPRGEIAFKPAISMWQWMDDNYGGMGWFTDEQKQQYENNREFSKGYWRPIPVAEVEAMNRSIGQLAYEQS